MALYAVDEDDLIFASDAENGKTYWCLDCFAPVKRRRGKHRLPHFYHTQKAPSCRLYSKTEDHLLGQLQLQKNFPPNALQMERPFTQISRIADLCWEDQKIIFEIQCSPISEIEAKARIADYQSIGYHVIWLLDDKRYNKKNLRPAEKFLRTQWTYYANFRPGLTSIYYDQFEVFCENIRVKKGKKLLLNLEAIRRKKPLLLGKSFYPTQILSLQIPRFIYKDRYHRALYFPHSMQIWQKLELILNRPKPSPSRLRKWIWQRITVHLLYGLKDWIRKIRENISSGV